MYELKTQKTDANVLEFISSIENKKRMKDSIALLDIIRNITDEIPKLWGTSIIGYGCMRYTNSTKKEYDWFKFGFSPRKNALTLYVTAYSDYIYDLAKVNGLKHGKGCVYIKDIDEVDYKVIEQMINYSFGRQV